jgi:hypothetical protein
MRVPIFPLNIVVFPGSLAPGHIFEDRYKTMVQHLLVDRGRFGIAMIKRRRAEGAPRHAVFRSAPDRHRPDQEQATGNPHGRAYEDRLSPPSTARASPASWPMSGSSRRARAAAGLMMVAARVASLFDEYYRHRRDQRRLAAKPTEERTWTWDLPVLADRHTS